MPDYRVETSWMARVRGPVAGVDEAGRAPLAGPVVAAAVILEPARCPSTLLGNLDDSKRIPRPRREALYDLICRHAVVGVGSADVEEIERINVLWASMAAMRRAVHALAEEPGAVVVDGDRMPDVEQPGEAVVGGDARCLSVAAASIVAKVVRDRRMIEYARVHDGYGWERNVGYSTREHVRGLERLGVTPLHRRGFATVRRFLDGGA